MLHFLINLKNFIIILNQNKFVSFTSVQRALYDKINKIITKEVESFMDIPEDFAYFNFLDKQSFLIKRTPKMLL